MDIQQALMEILFGRAIGESPADTELNRQGSLMGSQRTNQRQSEARQGPALSTLSKAVDFANPINWMGGMGGNAAAIAPTGNKMLRQLLEALRNKAPKLMQQVEDTGRMVYPYISEKMPAPGAYGTYRNVNPLAGQVDLWGMQPGKELESTLAHELRHFLTDPSLATKNPGHAAETAAQLGAMMPAKQQGGMSRYANPANPDEQLRAYNESLSYLTEALLSKGSGRSIIGEWSPYKMTNLRPDEGDPALEAVANALGQGIR